MLKWNKGKNYKKCRERRTIIKFRQRVANACGIPVKYIEGNHYITKEESNKIKSINKSFARSYQCLTIHLPRKLKKCIRRLLNV